MPSGVIRLRLARAAKTKREGGSDERPAPPPKRLSLPKRTKRVKRNENLRLAELAELTPTPVEKLLEYPQHGTPDPTYWAACCDAAPHAGVGHEGPHTYETKARSKWLNEQAKLVEGR